MEALLIAILGAIFSVALFFFVKWLIGLNEKINMIFKILKNE